jgi:hypothetical protein
MKLTELLKEGMYDKLVGEINKDIFKTIKAAMAGSGTQQTPKKYKGYPVRRDPVPSMSVGKMFENESRVLYVGEYSDNVSGIDLEVELKFAVTEDGVREGHFYIDGSAESEGDFPSIEVQIAVHPNDGEKMFSKIQPVLRDLVRHEVEHQTHAKKSINLKQSKGLAGDKAQRVKIRKNSDIYYKYFLLPKEVDSNIHGLYSKAKTLKQPYQKVVDDYLDSLIDNGTIQPKHRTMIYKMWKERIPKIGGIPTLK